MHYECEGCGRILKEDVCLQYAHFEYENGNRTTLIFCPTTFYGKKQTIWCLENTLHAFSLAMDANDDLIISVSTEVEIIDRIGGRYPRSTGKYSSLSELRQALESKINPDYERMELNQANSGRLAEGDYLLSSPWIREGASGRAIRKIRED